MADPTTPTTSTPTTRPTDVGDRLRGDLERSGALPRHVRADQAAIAVLCTLASRLSRGEVAKLAAALPERIAMIVRYCPRPATDAGERFDGEGFVQRVAQRLGIAPAPATRLVRAVFAAVHAQLPEREVQDAAAQLPKDLRALWLGDELFAPSVPLPPQQHPVPPVDEVPDLVGRGMLAEIEADGSIPEGLTALQVTAAVLGALARRVSGGEARAFVDALPPILKYQVAPLASHDEPPAARFDYAEMRDDVAARLAVWPHQADELIQLVFDVVRAHLRPTEVEDVASQLPRELKQRWLGRPH